MKFFDEPVNPRRANVALSGVIPDFATLMPGSGADDAIIAFLRDLQAGRRGYMNPTPFRRHYRPFTSRAVFKIHEIEHLMERVGRECRAQVVYLLRHPIATSLSRRVLPRLRMFLESAWYERLIGNPERMREIRRLAAAGNYVQRSIVSWCFENIVPLSPPAGADWLYLTYEELVLNPLRCCDLLMSRLQLADRRRLLQAFERPAANIRMSDEQTIEAMQEPDAVERRRRLVTKWRGDVGEGDIADAAQVLAVFGIDGYRADRFLAHPRFLHFDDTPALLAGT